MKTEKARLQLVLIAVAFIGPMLVAGWMYTSGRLLPAGRTNHGALLAPVTSLKDVLPSSAIAELADGRWLLLYVNERRCDDDCGEALHRLRQIRLMLGNEMERVERVFLRGDATPDKVSDENQHRGLIMITDKRLAALLEERRPEELPPGGMYLIDPLVNLVMYFSPEILPRDIVDDLKHLLELSRIG